MSSKVQSITHKFESLFKQMRSCSNEEYESIVLNIELLKKKYFISSFKQEKNKLFETTFRDLLKNLKEKN